ncbi:MAG: hypothetical protein RML40_06805 [Bacteroidota bacterium]|nr:hypothetical protein [Candidatus Kapabacteria bacterium]MDW8220226.1 hypothetical protein [Bacteroidota bacterium]
MCAGIALCFTNLFAQIPQVTFQLGDTSVQRGSVFRVAVRAVFRQMPRTLDSLSIVLRFAPSALAFNRALGGSTFVMQCPAPRVDSQFINLNSGILRISCNALRPMLDSTTSLTVATLEFLALAGPTTTTVLSIDSILINRTTLVPLGTTTARITLLSAPLVVGQFSDGIGTNYPNPTPLEGTVFPCTLAGAGNVEFAVLSALGTVLREYKSEFRQQGFFLFPFRPDGLFASGLYVLRMTTARGVVHRPFLIAR